MKFPISWLQEWSRSELNPETLLDHLTMAGLEVDKVQRMPKISDVYVGNIVRIKPHPSADRLHICMVDIGAKRLLQIVCGAPNAYEGMHAPVAVSGAQFNDLTITERTIRGVISAGMLCSADELGLVYQSDGLLDIGDNIPVGTDFIKYLWLYDTLIEIDLTPNRADCFSIKGIAREVAVLTGRTLEKSGQNTVPVSLSRDFPVTVTATDACPRYLTRVVTGLNTDAVTPLWMKERLCRCGVRPVYPVVDVMNYVMLELGQPMHAFDLSRIHGSLTVRFADVGEKITLLDSEKEVQLSDDTLIIATEEEPIAIAGIIGGQNSAVTKDTKDILIECAFFSPQAIAGKARSYNLHTEASRRFERGVDFCLQKDAMEYACELLMKICGGQFGELTEVVTEQYLPKMETIKLYAAEITKRLGVSIDGYWIQKVLGHLSIKSKPCKGGWLCTVPTHRFDLSIEADLIEEVGRIYGYDQIPANPPQFCYTRLSNTFKRHQLLDCWRNKLTAAAYSEVLTYSFSDPELLQAVEDSEILLLNNPISPVSAGMRTSLWPGLLKTLVYNLNHQQDQLRIFEIGDQYRIHDGELQQSLILAGLAYGSVCPEQWGQEQRITDFYDIKSDLQQLLAHWEERIHYQPEYKVTALHPGKAARIMLDDTMIGYLGILNPELETLFEVPTGVCLFQIALGKIPAYDKFNYQPLSRYPAVRRDISILTAENLNTADLRACILANKPNVLQNVFLFDMYRGKNIEKGRKSVAFRLIFQDFSSTLYEQDIEKYMADIIAKLNQQFDIQIRRT